MYKYYAGMPEGM